MTAPAGDLYVEINKEGKTVLPNGRFITPPGLTHEVAPHPYGLVESPDGRIAVTSNSGTNPLSISILRDITSEKPEIQQIPPGPSTDEGRVTPGGAHRRQGHVARLTAGGRRWIPRHLLRSGLVDSVVTG